LRVLFILLTSFKQFPELYPETGHDHFLPNRINFTEHDNTLTTQRLYISSNGPFLLFQVVTFATLLAATYAVRVYEGNSYGRYGPVATIAHAPTVRYTHAPAALVHAPVQVEHHVSLICQAIILAVGYNVAHSP
jgi:hypothetical protein